MWEAPDFSEVRGQAEAKRALEIAASGGHNVLLIGPPGSGKSMLAKRLPSILPDMTFAETLETTKIHSIAGTLPPGSPLILVRPFLSPHPVYPAAAQCRARAKSRWRTTGFSFWTSCPNSAAPPWRFCASPWRTGW